MLFSTADDFNLCNKIVRFELNKRKINISDNVRNKIVEDVMNISYSKGGGYSSEILQSFAETYIEEEFYKKYYE